MPKFRPDPRTVHYPRHLGLLDDGSSLTAADVEFGRAVQLYRRRYGHWPAVAEYHAILVSLGWTLPDGTNGAAPFVAAVHAYRKRYGRPLPACSEYLAVLQSLGYEQTGPAAALPRYRRTDEPPRE